MIGLDVIGLEMIGWEVIGLEVIGLEMIGLEMIGSQLYICTRLKFNLLLLIFEIQYTPLVYDSEYKSI